MEKDDFIETSENLTEILENFKKEGGRIDKDGAIYYISSPKIVNEVNFNQEDSDELKEKKKFSDSLKIVIYSKNAIIRQRFFKDIDASYGNALFKLTKPLENFAVKSHKTKNCDFIFQFWEMSHESIPPEIFPLLFSNNIIGSREFIYFYHINEKIQEDVLKLVKNGIRAYSQILFVVYDSILPKNPENNDQNIPIIQKYYPNFNSLYISTDNQGCMFRVLDKIVELYFEFLN